MDTILSLSKISKGFPGVQALSDVSLDIYQGEVHALMGENGAGKSTLMKVLAGLYQADDGEIIFKGKPIVFHNPQEALEHGISMVHQEMLPVLDRTVAENIYLGREPVYGRTSIVNTRLLNAMTEELLRMMHLDGIKPGRKMRSLSIAEMQLVEIAKAISFHPGVIIMDEPTSAISDREVKKLFDLIGKLKEEGIAIIYISHRMDEIFQICDRITVLRDGKLIGTKRVDEVDQDTLISMMVGRELKDIFPKGSYVRDQVVLKVSDYSSEGLFKNVNFTLKKGEILGISGLMGAGRTELVETIFGFRKGGHGKIEKDGKEISIHSPQQAIAYGIALMPEDRKTVGLNLIASVKDNLSVISLNSYCKGGLVMRRREEADSRGIVEKLHIKTPGMSQKVGNLSGGNQQKIVIGKWLLSNCDIFIMDEPTRGIDVGAKTEIYNIIKNLASQGKSIIMISSEMSEIIGLCDRTLVMHEGEITGELVGAEISQESIMRYASGL